MEIDAAPLRATRKTGNEKFRDGERDLHVELLSFWQWSASDLVSNTMRGRLAEYVVALALGVAGGVRREWDAHDLVLDNNIKIEVKSSAYVQAWHQKKLSRIEFKVGKRLAWSAETNTVAQEPRRSADVYVFALLRHEDRGSLDPLDVSQWVFFVLPTAMLDARTRSQHSITLKSLQAIAGPSTSFSGLRDVVITAAMQQRAHVQAGSMAPSAAAPDRQNEAQPDAEQLL